MLSGWGVDCVNARVRCHYRSSCSREILKEYVRLVRTLETFNVTIEDTCDD